MRVPRPGRRPPADARPTDAAPDDEPRPAETGPRPTELDRLVGWLDERTGAAEVARVALHKVFPDHWSFLLGEIALFCYVVLFATGLYLTFFFTADTRPVTYAGPYAPLDGAEVSAAFDSVMRLSFDVRAGLLMRQVHHWAALVFLAAIVVHASRVFFTGAFRRPREINWLIGMGLLLMALAAGITGYSLPDDLLSGTGLRIVVLGRPVDPVRGSVAGVPRVRWRLPDERADRPPVRLPHHAVAAPDDRDDHGPPRDPVAAEAHPVPRRTGHRGQWWWGATCGRARRSAPSGSCS